MVLCAYAKFQVVMAIEDEFVIEIPDQEADKIVTIADAIAYISEHPQAKQIYCRWSGWSRVYMWKDVGVFAKSLESCVYWLFVLQSE